MPWDRNQPVAFAESLTALLERRCAGENYGPTGSPLTSMFCVFPDNRSPGLDLCRVWTKSAVAWSSEPAFAVLGSADYHAVRNCTLSNSGLGRDRDSRLPITGDLPIFGIRDAERIVLQLGQVPGRPDLRKTDVRETTSGAFARRLGQIRGDHPTLPVLLSPQPLL